MRELNKQSFILKHGVRVYAVYQNNDVKVKGTIVFNKDSWYIEVDNNGQIKRYSKVIGKGKLLRHNTSSDKLQLTIDHWYDKIKSQLKLRTI